MKAATAICWFAFAAALGCSVDTSRLSHGTMSNPDTPTAVGPEVAPEAASDRPADAGPDVGAVHPGDDVADARADEPGGGDDAGAGNAEGDADAGLGAEEDVSPSPPDATSLDDTIVERDLSPPSDSVPPSDPLPPSDPVPPPSDPVPPLWDLPPDQPDGSTLTDVLQATPDADAAGDLADAGDVADTAGDSNLRGNGSACTTAGQCQSGFCLGTPGHCCSQGCTSACYRPNQCGASGACVPAAGTISCSNLDALCGLTVNDPANARDWSFQTNLQVGDLATSTDPHTLSAVPASLVGATWIRPSRLTKSSTNNPLVTFTLTAPADVYVGIDDRLTVPSWMASWTDTGLTISYLVISTGQPNTTVTQRLFQMTFPAGDVSLGPLGCFNSNNCSMYLTIIEFTDQAGGPAPTCQ